MEGKNLKAKRRQGEREKNIGRFKSSVVNRRRVRLIHN
jgi:hypothetical protein